MRLLEQDIRNVKRTQYQFETEEGITLNYVRIDDENGEVLSETISNRTGYPLDPTLDSKIINRAKQEVERIESGN